MTPYIIIGLTTLAVLSIVASAFRARRQEAQEDLESRMMFECEGEYRPYTIRTTLHSDMYSQYLAEIERQQARLDELQERMGSCGIRD